jgi:hypothetical protein
MSENPYETMEQEPKKRCYVSRLFHEAGEDLSILDIFIELVVVVIMTAILLALKVAASSESRELYYSAILYFSVSLVVVIFIKVFIRTPYKIIKQYDEQIASLLERFKPKFKLSCSRDMVGCHVPSLNGQWSIRRVQVVADCESAIKNCRGHLIKVEKDGVVVFGHDTLVLPFAKSEAEDCLAKTLHPHIPEYLDVLCWFNPGNIVHFATKPIMPALDHERQYVFNKEGIYILTVSVTGDGPLPGTIKLKFKWGNPFNEAVLEQL